MNQTGIIVYLISVFALVAAAVFIGLRRPAAILNLDRRVIYLLIALCVLAPMFLGMNLPFSVTPEVQKCYDDIKLLKAGDPIVIGCDYGPDSFPECQPMLIALLHQCFQQKLRPILIALTPAGDQMASRGLHDVLGSKDPKTGQPVYANIQNGTDYSLLGYQAGTNAVILALRASFVKTYPNDRDGNPTLHQQIYQDVHGLADINYIVDIAAVAMPEAWLTYGSGPLHIKLSVCTTAVSVSQYYPYYHTGQFRGLIGGMKGSAEYEKLVDVAGITGVVPNATKGMDSQSLAHLMLVMAIIVVNLFFFLDRRRDGSINKGKGGAAAVPGGVS